MRNSTLYEQMPIEDEQAVWDFVSEADDDPDYCEEPSLRRRSKPQAYDPNQKPNQGYNQASWAQQQGLNLTAETLEFIGTAPLDPLSQQAQLQKYLLTPPDRYASCTKPQEDAQNYYSARHEAHSQLDLPSPMVEPLPPTMPCYYLDVPYQMPHGYGHTSSTAVQEFDYSELPCPTNGAPAQAQSPPARQHLPPLVPYLAAASDGVIDPLQHLPTRYHSPLSPLGLSPLYNESYVSPPSHRKLAKKSSQGICKDMKVKLPKFAPKSQMGSFGKINMRIPNAWKRQHPKRRKGSRDTTHTLDHEDIGSD